MKAIAIDDEPMALEVIRSHASKVPFLDLKNSFTNALKALEYLHRETIDLIFIDIKMPDISGIEFVNSLPNKPLVIFTTAYSEHAVIGFELDAVDYLLKPFSLARFVRSCNKALELHELRNATEIADHLYVKTGYEQVKVNYSDILYLEASGNYVTFILKDKKILSRSTFMEAWNLMPRTKFIRCHRSFIVAIDKITKIERHQLSVDKTTVPISEAYSIDVMKILGI